MLIESFAPCHFKAFLRLITILSPAVVETIEIPGVIQLPLGVSKNLFTGVTQKHQKTHAFIFYNSK